MSWREPKAAKPAPRPDCWQCKGEGIVWLGGNTFTGCACPPEPPPLETALETQARMTAEERK